MKIKLREERDIQRLMHWREEVIAHVFGEQPDAALLAANRDYYLRTMASGEHLALVAEADGCECGCGAICLGEELPSPDNPLGRTAYLMNIYVREPYRNHGIAHALVKRLIEEAQGRRCGKIYLESTPEGKPVYFSIGFRDMPDMMKYHDDQTHH